MKSFDRLTLPQGQHGISTTLFPLVNELLVQLLLQIEELGKCKVSQQSVEASTINNYNGNKKYCFRNASSY